MLRIDPSQRISVKDALAHPYLQQYSFPSDEPICLEPLYIEDEVDDFEQDILKGWIFDECVSWQSEKLLETSQPEPVIENVVVEIPNCENSVLSLREIMTDPEEPILLEDIVSHSFKDNYFLGEKFDVTEHLGFENNNEELAVLTAALKIMSLDRVKDQGKEASEQCPNIPSVLDSVFGKGYLKETVDFSCKRNVFNGPFGLCYF